MIPGKHDSMDEMMLHVFIQWLTSKNLLDQWLTLAVEEQRENIDSMGEMLLANPSESCNYCFSWGEAAHRGYKNWSRHHRDWQRVHAKAMDVYWRIKGHGS